MKTISFDFDGVLTTTKGKDWAKEYMAKGDKIIIVTARQKSDSADVFKVADELGIDRSDVYFTEGRDKWPLISELKPDKHIDNNLEQVQKIRENTNTEGWLFK